MTGTTMPGALAPHQMLRIGQPVHVNLRASWLPATVTCLTPREVGVAYQTAGPVALTDTVVPWAVRPADGAVLRPARRVIAGDEVIFGNGTRTVAAPPWKGRDGWLVVHFTDGGQPALILPGAVLRLVDRTAAVTVTGLPITH